MVYLDVTVITLMVLLIEILFLGLVELLLFFLLFSFFSVPAEPVSGHSVPRLGAPARPGAACLAPAAPVLIARSLARLSVPD